MSGSGEWTLYYDWGCSGSYSTSLISMNSDGTFSLPPYTGKWWENEGKIMWRFDTAPNSVYSGDHVDLVMTGISSTFTGLNGCWYAMSSALAGQEKPSVASGREVDAAGNQAGSV